ncbi:phage portal protein family protein, partial [Staphylococcus pasteuri_A]
LEAARSGSADYETQRKALDQAISKIVLSQTMTTDNGSSQSQAKVHSDVKEDVIKADADLICESLNNTAVTWLTNWNFPGAKPPK